ncbi:MULTISPECIES: C40 family peptidase [Burkholderia cepacia complex]|uniref:C40 family peptidase n=1 Tax=Burkholderia stagnalis TaxID=1503054 RepID=UPI0009ECBF8D
MRITGSELRKSSSPFGKAAAFSMAVVMTLATTSPCRADAMDERIDGESLLSSETADPPVVESTLERLQSEALRLIGVRYRYGGSTPQTGFDCSGLVRYVLHHTTTLYVGRTAESMATEGRQVQRAELRVGDLVFFNTRGRIYSHVGIYLGSGRFIHSPSPGSRVRVDDLSNAYWQSHYSGARRVIL